MLDRVLQYIVILFLGNDHEWFYCDMEVERHARMFLNQTIQPPTVDFPPCVEHNREGRHISETSFRIVAIVFLGCPPIDGPAHDAAVGRIVTSTTG